MLLQQIKEVVSKKVKIRKEKAIKEKLARNNVLVDVVQSRNMSPTCVVNSMSNWRRKGSFSLPPV
jgi:hypothetical protein